VSQRNRDGGNRKMDYKNETEKLDKGGNTYKPEEGQHRIEILEEPEETVYKDEDGNVTPQLKLLIKEDLKPEILTWYIGKGVTSKSIYGQLMKVGAKQGQLKGQTLTLFVTRAKNKSGQWVNSYMIPESLTKSVESVNVNDQDPNKSVVE